MPEHQANLPLDASHAPEPAAVPELLDEVARLWSLPLGERVEVVFKDGQLDSITGVLELVTAPAYPWNPRETLVLRIAGFTFSSRAIAHWMKI